jgi:5-methylcytosine-specific restriction endonuclease McrA
MEVISGIRHEVDHIVALCLGGQHMASNLQVLTAAANNEKAKGEQVKTGRKGRRPRASP